MEGKTRVLLYGASEEFSDSCRLALQQSNTSFAFTYAKDREALERLAARFPPHIVLLDDARDPTQHLREVHRLWPGLPTILLSEPTVPENTAAHVSPVSASLDKSRLPALSSLISGLSRPPGPSADLDGGLPSAALADAVPDGIAILSLEGRILHWNPAAERLLGHPRGEAQGRELLELLGLEPAGAEAADYVDCLRRLERESPSLEPLEFTVRHSSGDELPIELFLSRLQVEGQGRILAFLRDLSERRETELKLERLMSYDPLTGLPGRSLFLDRVSQALIRGRRNGTLTGVLLLDLDHFNLVNESLGHHVGDELLKAIAQRLVGTMRSGDTIARQAGDEFAIALADLRTEADCHTVAKKLIGALEHPFAIAERELFVSASIGIALHPRDGNDEQLLLKAAESAMYSAKESGRKRFEYYTPGMNAHLAERLALESDLQRALNEAELLLHYQPKIELRAGRIVGVEALIRWQHRERGLLMPAEFLGTAQESGLIVPVGEWVLRTACAQGKAWHDQGFDIVVSVNIAVAQLRDHGFVEQVHGALQESGLPPTLLELELNESILLSHSASVGAVLRSLKTLGVQISVDDFWMGYSSVREFRRFPIDKVKIDRSFMKDIVDSPEAASIVGAVISLAQHLNLKVIAEGVETQEQLEFLRLRRCDEAQGYFFSRPKPAAEIGHCLERGSILPLARPELQSARTLLLVDNEENILRSLTRLLRQDGYHILKTTSPAEALRVMVSHGVGVVVSDQRMPEMSGVEFFRQLKRWYPDTVRLVLSGYTELKSVTDAINEGAVYKFITKPWDDDQLRATIQEAFERYELKRNNDRLMGQLAETNEQLLRTQQALESKVRDQAGISERNLNVLNVSRELLEYLPVGVVGVDEEGMVVLANQRAQEVLGPGIVGALAEDCLPEPLRELICQSLQCRDEEILGLWTTSRGVQAKCWCHALGKESAGRGTVLVFAEFLGSAEA